MKIKFRLVLTICVMLLPSTNLFAQMSDLDRSAFKAVKTGNEEALTELINNGLSADTYDEENVSLLHMATMENHIGIVELLLGGEPSLWNIESENILTTAVANNYNEIAVLLIDYGVDLKTSSALLSATLSGNNEMAEKLIDWGADLEQINNEGLSPLHMAVLSGNIDLVKKLLEKNAPIEQRRSNMPKGETPLLMAITFGESEIVEKLVDAGADINVKGPFSASALHVAVQNDFSNIVKYLLEAGANKHAIDQVNRNALYYAKQAPRNKVIIKLLRKY